ncbi:hypothetical protein [Streptomyces sp. NPDC021203]
MPAAAPHSERYAHLVTRGQIRLVAATTADLDRVLSGVGTTHSAHP